MVPDFDPKGKSDAEVMRFQALMSETLPPPGPPTPMPAGDIGVRSVHARGGFMASAMKKLSNGNSGVFYRQGHRVRRGSLVRRGYRLWHGVFPRRRCCAAPINFDGLRVSISGSGNVAQYAAEGHRAGARA